MWQTDQNMCYTNWISAIPNRCSSLDTLLSLFTLPTSPCCYPASSLPLFMAHIRVMWTMFLSICLCVCLSFITITEKQLYIFLWFLSPCREGYVFSPFICLSVCLIMIKHYSNSYKWIAMKLYGWVQDRKNWLHFSGDVVLLSWVNEEKLSNSCCIPWSGCW